MFRAVSALHETPKAKMLAPLQPNPHLSKLTVKKIPILFYKYTSAAKGAFNTQRLRESWVVHDV